MGYLVGHGKGGGGGPGQLPFLLFSMDKRNGRVFNFCHYRSIIYQNCPPTFLRACTQASRVRNKSEKMVREFSITIILRFVKNVKVAYSAKGQSDQISRRL